MHHANYSEEIATCINEMCPHNSDGVLSSAPMRGYCQYYVNRK